MPAKNNPFFSIIVPAYNVEAYISECVESVLSQDFQDFELILVDDGSTDHTGEICDEYQKAAAESPMAEHQKSTKIKTQTAKTSKNHPQPSIASQISENVNISSAKSRILVIHQPNSGLSGARNTGVDAASGEYLIFLDGDDFLIPGALTAIKRGLGSGDASGLKNISEIKGSSNLKDNPKGDPESRNNLEPSLDLLRYQAEEVFDSGRVEQHEEAGFGTLPGVEAFTKLARFHYTENAWLYAYRREFFVQNNFRYAKGCIAEDFGLTPLVIAKAKTVKAIPDICYAYRQREGSIMHDPAKLARRTSDLEHQLGIILPQIAKIPGSRPVLHYLVVSFLTEAAKHSESEFLQIYQKAQKSGLLKYIHPGSPRAVPRSLLLKYFPKIFYRVYR